MGTREEYVEWAIEVETSRNDLTLRLLRRVRMEEAPRTDGTVISGLTEEVTGTLVFNGLMQEDRLPEHSVVHSIAQSIKQRIATNDVVITGFEAEKVKKWIFSHHTDDLAERLMVLREYESYVFRSIERDYRVSFVEEAGKA